MTQHTAPVSRPDTRSLYDTGLDVVTGAFSYSGRAIAERLARSGRSIRTLTGHPDRQPPGSLIECRPLDFDDLPGLVRSLQGAHTLYNTYWIRFARGRVNHDVAVANSRVLFHAARSAGVRRIVHISITNPSVDSPFPYFRGKALVERALAETGVPYAILRPAILFGGDGVLINNIAWLLRRLPVFAIGGRGDYRIRGIHIDDLAELAVQAGRTTEDVITDAVGPDRPTFLELVEMIRAAVHSRSLLVRVPGPTLPIIATALRPIINDVLLTYDEYHAMAAGLADTPGPATGTTRISEWITNHAAVLGAHYANEIQRHFSQPTIVV